MKNILIPVDFSETSHKAATYAVYMAKRNADMHLVFYHSYKFMDVDTVITSLEEDAAHSMYIFLQELLNNHPDLNYSHVLDQHLLIEGIQLLVEIHNIDLIIMGSKGKSAISQKLIGSNTITVAQESKVPVLVIPEKANFDKLESMLIALPFNCIQEGVMPIDSIKKISKDWHLKLYFATVEQSTSPSKLFDIFSDQQSIMDKMDSADINYVVLDGKDIANAMLSYADAQEISWLCTIVEEKGFWQRLIKGSVTAALASISTKPILVFNSKK